MVLSTCDEMFDVGSKVNWHHLSWFLPALSTNSPLAAWLLKHAEACITMSLQLHRVEPVGRRAGGHVWVGHWYSTRWVLMQWKERGGGKAWPKTSGCNHKIYGYPWKSRWCKVWKSCFRFHGSSRVLLEWCEGLWIYFILREVEQLMWSCDLKDPVEDWLIAETQIDKYELAPKLRYQHSRGGQKLKNNEYSNHQCRHQ